MPIKHKHYPVGYKQYPQDVFDMGPQFAIILMFLVIPFFMAGGPHVIFFCVFVLRVKSYVVAVIGVFLYIVVYYLLLMRMLILTNFPEAHKPSLYNLIEHTQSQTELLVLATFIVRLIYKLIKFGSDSEQENLHTR